MMQQNRVEACGFTDRGFEEQERTASEAATERIG